jgi:WW domain
MGAAADRVVEPQGVHVVANNHSSVINLARLHAADESDVAAAAAAVSGGGETRSMPVMLAPAAVSQAEPQGTTTATPAQVQSSEHGPKSKHFEVFSADTLAPDATAAAAAASAAVDCRAVAAAAPLPDSEPVLAPGWSMRVDSGSGHEYFVNVSTGESSWDAPLAHEGGGMTWSVAPETVHGTAAASHDTEGAAAANVAAVQQPSQSMVAAAAPDAPLPRWWAERAVDGATTYFVCYGTRESSWTRPDADVVVTIAEGEAAAGARGGWIEVMEPSGARRSFFVNVVTRTSGWVRPQELN